MKAGALGQEGPLMTGGKCADAGGGVKKVGIYVS